MNVILRRRGEESDSGNKDDREAGMDSILMPVIFGMVKVLAMLNSKVITMTVVLEAIATV